MDKAKVAHTWLPNFLVSQKNIVFIPHPSPGYPEPGTKLPPSLSGPHPGPGDLHRGPGDLSLHHQKFDFYRAQGADSTPSYT